MGNNTQKQTNNLLGQQQKDVNSGYNPAINEANNRSNSTYYDSQSRIPGLDSAYSNLQSTGGFNPGDFDAYRATFGSGGGGSSVASSLASGGGIDPSVFDKALQGYGDFASSGGGVDAEGIRAHANRAIPQFYKNIQNEQSRRALVNPYSPSMDASNLALTRQAGQQTQENVRDTETGISNLITQGREFGIKGLGDLNTSIQDMIQRGKIAGGQQEIANAGLGEQAAARRQAGEGNILDMINQGRLKGIAGAADLQNQQNTSGQNWFQQYLAGLGGRTSGNQNAINDRQNTTPWWQNILNAGAGSAGAFFGGRTPNARGGA